LPAEALRYFIAHDAEFVAIGIAEVIAQEANKYGVKKSNFSIYYYTDYPDVSPLIFVPEIEDVKG
jgi:hypothetical protein